MMDHTRPGVTSLVAALNASNMRVNKSEGYYDSRISIPFPDNVSTSILPHQEPTTSEDWGYISLENVRRLHVGDEIVLNRYIVILYGCILPFFAIMTLCTNCVICVTLCRRGMRNATASILIAIALSEMSMAIWPVPPFIYFFTLGNFIEWMPYNWCYVSLWMLEFLPTIFHGSAVWLTVALAGQRFLAVCKPLETQQWCISHTPGAIQCSFVIVILVMATQLSRIFESNFSPTRLPSRVNIGATVTGCTSDFAPFINAFADTYFKVYYCFKTLALHLLPCIIVMYLTLRIVITKVKSNFPKGPNADCTDRTRLKKYFVRLVEGKYTTNLILGFLALFLVVEIPLASFYAIELLQNKLVFEFDIIGSDTLTSMILFANLSSVLSSPVKFLIFTIFCRKFRMAMKELCVDMKDKCKCGKDEDDEELE